MSALSDYVSTHTAQLGASSLTSADLVFFHVEAKPSADAVTLRALIEAHRGEYGDVTPLDGRQHNYLELGAWIGDQGDALALMGLGSLLGLWKLFTPRNVFGASVTDAQVQALAGQGMIAISTTGAPGWRLPEGLGPVVTGNAPVSPHFAFD